MIEGSIIEQLDNLGTFKISCSQIGKIIGEGRTKSYKDKIDAQKSLIQETQEKHNAMKEGKAKDNCFARIEKQKTSLANLIQAEIDESNLPKLSETAKTYCEDWVKSRLYEIRKGFKSKYTDKGNLKEEDAIRYCESVFEGADGWFMAEKNDERKSNDWIEGECDLNLTDEIVDIKNSWDLKTFPLFKKEIPTVDYEWQLNGYMWLWGKEKGRVIYVLMSLPEEMIMKEVWNYFGYGVQYTQEQFNEFTAQFRYDDYPRELRIKEYAFDFDQKKIEQIIFKVGECRKYITILVNDLKTRLKNF